MIRPREASSAWRAARSTCDIFPYGIACLQRIATGAEPHEANFAIICIVWGSAILLNIILDADLRSLALATHLHRIGHKTIEEGILPSPDATTLVAIV